MVRTKNRRRIVCGERNYIWYVLTDEETPILNIISEDKRLILTLPINAPKPYAVSKGREFQGEPTSGCWERYFLPFALPEAITPKIVSEIIEWANSGENVGTLKYGDEGFIL